MEKKNDPKREVDEKEGVRRYGSRATRSPLFLNFLNHSENAKKSFKKFGRKNLAVANVEIYNYKKKYIKKYVVFRSRQKRENQPS